MILSSPMELQSKSKGRDDIRRRNREIIDKANAELRTEHNAEQPITRFKLFKSQSALPQLTSSVRFEVCAPPVEVGLILCDHSLVSKPFSTFQTGTILMDSFRETLLLREDSLCMPDMVNIVLRCENQDLAKVSSFDSKLLKDEHAAVADRDSHNRYLGEELYGEEPKLKRIRADTAHFLRRPQMMTSEASTALSINQTKPEEKTGDITALEDVEDQFARVSDLNRAILNSERLMNAVSKRLMKARRSLDILPMSSKTYDRLQQVKFDETPDRPTAGGSVITMDPVRLSGEVIYRYYRMDQSSDSFSLIKQYTKSIEGGSAKEQRKDEFFIVSLPADGRKVSAFLGSAGPKMLLKKSAQAVDAQRIVLASV